MAVVSWRGSAEKSSLEVVFSGELEQLVVRGLMSHTLRTRLSTGNVGKSRQASSDLKVARLLGSARRAIPML